MFRKLYTPIAVIVAIVIIALAFWQGYAMQQGSVNAEADISELQDANSALIITNQGVLDQVSSDVDISIKVPQNVTVKAAIGHFYDVQTWVDGTSYFTISGLESWQTEQVKKVDDFVYSYTTANPGDTNSAPEAVVQSSEKTFDASKVNSDMWDLYAENNGETDIQWVKKSNVDWSLLISLKSIDNTPIANAKVEFTWKQAQSNDIMIIALMLAIVIMSSVVVLNFIWRRQNSRGTHTGDSKKLVDMVNMPSGEFVLPKSSQIPNVREFAKIKQNMDSQSKLLTGHVPSMSAYSSADTGAAQTGFFVSPVESNDWRYYDANSTQKEYYDAQISRTADFSHDSNANSSQFSSPNITLDPALAGITPAPSAISEITQFNAVQKLEDAGDTSKKPLSRKELRQQGFFGGKGKNKGEKDDA